jgi:hypothetical protein
MRRYTNSPPARDGGLTFNSWWSCHIETGILCGIHTGTPCQRKTRSSTRDPGHEGAPDAVRLGPLHGYGIDRRIEQISGDHVLLNQGTIYASLARLQQRGWIAAEWVCRKTTGKGSSTP